MSHTVIRQCSWAGGRRRVKIRRTSTVSLRSIYLGPGVPMSTIQLEDVIKTYRMGEVGVRALYGVDLAINDGEMVAIMGLPA
jgi:hypothetical protein